jgi:insertion element IS1 protein InsB
MACPQCQSGWSIKYGRTSAGKQRYRCRRCGRQFVIQPAHPQYCQGFREQVLAALNERISLRGAERVFHVARQMIALWLKHKADEVEKKQQSSLTEGEIIRSQDGIFLLEVDEMWNFVGHKENQQWLWVALERRSRRILAWVNGDRTAATAQRLWDRLPPLYQRESHCFTDFWAAYERVIPADQHTACGKASGQTNHIERWNTTLRQRVG